MLSITEKSVTPQVLTFSKASMLGASVPGSDSEPLGRTLREEVHKNIFEALTRKSFPNGNLLGIESRKFTYEQFSKYDEGEQRRASPELMEKSGAWKQQYHLLKDLLSYQKG